MRPHASSRVLCLVGVTSLFSSFLAACGGSSSETPPPRRPDFEVLAATTEETPPPAKPNAKPAGSALTRDDPEKPVEKSSGTWGTEPAAPSAPPAPDDVKIELKE